MKTTLMIGLVFGSLTAFALYAADAPPEKSSMADCPMMKDHGAQVNARGDKAMGFSHEKTTHHFRLLMDGGVIEVAANDADDSASRDQIRGHLRHIAQLFSEGNFAIPMLVHAEKPPGSDLMAQLKTQIQYNYEQTSAGGLVRIKTIDANALQAVHEFLRFQIQDHQTGDPLDVKKS